VGSGNDVDPDEVQLKVARLRQVVESARSRGRSSTALVDRAEVLGLVDEVDAAVRSTLSEAARVLEEKEAVIDEGRVEAARIVADAERRRDTLVSDTDVYRVARRQAETLLERARADDRAMRQETDEYVDAKLANFEVTLSRTSEAVRRGRERLAGRSDYAAIAPDEG
jgi:cell division septum initiation protein DivIVA